MTSYRSEPTKVPPLMEPILMGERQITSKPVNLCHMALSVMSTEQGKGDTRS